LKYRQRPTDLPAVQKQIGRLRAQFREALVYRYVVEQINEGRRVLRLDDEQGRLKYEIRAERAEHDPKDFRPELLRVSVREHLSGHVRDYQAGRCQVRVERGLGTVPLIIQLRLTDEVTLTDDRSGGGQRFKKPNQPLESVPVPPGLTDQEARLSDLELLDISEAMVRQAVSGRRPARPPPYRFRLGDQVEDARNATLYQIVEEALQVVGVIHSRVAFSVSILVMLVLAAALAIIWRGGQLLTAFVISFIPGLLIVVMNIAGRQMSEKPDTHLVGLVVIWAGIGLLAVADLVVLGKFLRR
ncbi:MAG: LptF/LptG family permease, partial [Phycisphaerae bacterium]